MGASLEESAPCFIQECAGTLSASKSAWYSPPETAAALPVQGLTHATVRSHKGQQQQQQSGVATAKSDSPLAQRTRSTKETVMMGNIQGLYPKTNKNKVPFLKELAEHEDPMIIALTETHFKSECSTLNFTCAMNRVKELLDYLPRPLPNIVMCGDFNFPHIKWPEGIVFGGTSEEQVQARALMELSDREFLSQQIRQPTRQNNILDLFFTNNPASINLHRAENNIFSYHNLIIINTTYKRKSTLRYEGNSSAGSSPFKAYNFYTEYIKWEGVQHSISEMDWEQVLAGENPNIMLEVLTSKLLEVCSAHVPVKKRLTNGSVVTDPGTMSQLLLHQYNQVFSVPRQDKIVRWQTTFFNEAAPQEHAQLTNITISLEAMERAIREIKPNAAAVPAILAKCSKALAQPLCILWRCSMDRGVVPVELKKATEVEVVSGVPQQSVLDPLLFLVHMTDIGVGVSDSLLTSFEDDTTVSLPTTSAEEVSCLQQDVDAVYATSNMQFNEEKFELLRHGHNQEIKEIMLHTEGGQGITPQPHFKCLGVQLSEHCSIQYHIVEAVKKARTFTSREPETLLTLWRAPVQPLLD
ncbi:hypothetical protein Pmani_011497 [Petrolisthes manimaculis]|uniref:Endonuclease/exonuclease/phosphatase domain-containing protein n=1 Tax=Petrolisthes manimaculis TaxID=1843537 RepID=A0AAE1PZY1_9EUCA|nr:hypothetical protein Pmani_011497 [Petrolisthes manimaculis]